MKANDIESETAAWVAEQAKHDNGTCVHVDDACPAAVAVETPQDEVAEFGQTMRDTMNWPAPPPPPAVQTDAEKRQRMRAVKAARRIVFIVKDKFSWKATAKDRENTAQSLADIIMEELSGK